MLLLLKITLYGCAVLTTLAASLPQPREWNGKVSLVLSIDAPPTVNGVSNFTISGTLKNEGTQDILVIKDPNGILYEFFTADALEFDKTDAAKDTITRPSYIGYRAKWDLKSYLKADVKGDIPLLDVPKDVIYPTAEYNNTRPRVGQFSDDSNSLSYTDSIKGESFKSGDKRYPPGTTLDLPAGKSLSFNYEVGSAYDFSKSGAGAYTFKLKRDFFHVLVDGVHTKTPVNLKGLNKVNIEGDLKAKNPKLAGDTNKLKGRSIVKRAGTSITTQGCDDAQISVIDVAAQHANVYAQESYRYVSAMTGPTPRYEQWFGKWNTGPKAPYEWRPRDQVADMYKSMTRHSFLDPGDAGGYSYDCTCTETLTAYVVPREDFLPPDASHPAIIFLCDGFHWDTVSMIGSDSKAGALIHEAAHLTYHLPATEDYREFQEDCQQLATDDPFCAATNSDNYQYFSENDPVLA